MSSSDRWRRLGFRSKDVDSLGDSAEDFDDVQDDLIEALLDATERALEDMAGLANSPKYVYLFIWGFTSLSTLYRSYHDG